MVAENSTKTTRTLWICVPIRMILTLVFFAKSYCKSPCDGTGGAVKRHAVNQSLQRSFNNQILDYKAMLDLCENKMMSVKLF